MTPNLLTGGSGPAGNAPSETRSDVVRRLMAAVESNASDEYAAYFTDDARYKVGNAEPVVGPDGIRRLAAAVMELVVGVVHDVKNIWEMGDTVICEMELVYRRKDGKTVKVPNVNIIQFEGDRVRNYQAFLDTSPVFS